MPPVTSKQVQKILIGNRGSSKDQEKSSWQQQHEGMASRRRKSSFMLMSCSPKGIDLSKLSDKSPPHNNILKGI